MIDDPTEMMGQEQEEERATQLWMVPFSDLMSLMVIFFLALYAFSVNKPDPCTELINAVRAVGAKPLQGGTTVRLTVPSNVLFDSGSAELKPEGLKPLVVLADALKSRPFSVRVEGHTDNVPPGENLRYGSNWELSSARAFSVLRFFSDQGIGKDRLEAVGCGEYRPVASNETPGGRAANRRIEISLVCTPPVKHGAAALKPS